MPIESHYEATKIYLYSTRNNLHITHNLNKANHILEKEISKSLDKDTEGVNGIIVKGKITKSKVCAPYGTFEYYLELGKGIAPYYEIMNLGIENEIITKVGNTYSYNDAKIGVGLGQVETFLKDNLEVQEEIEQKILSKISTKPQEIIETTENQ